MAKYCEIPAAFTWEIIDECEDIGNWELLFNGNVFKGKGIEEFVNVAKTLQDKDDITVIFCKKMKWLIYLMENHFNFEECDYRGRAGKEGVDYFYITLKEEGIELRNWDNFWNKIDSNEDFIKRLEVCRKIFNHRRGAIRKNIASLEDHYRYTLAKDMWSDIMEEHYLYQPWARNFCDELAPQDEDEMFYMECLDKAGFYYVNDEKFNEPVYHVHRYDICSDYLSLLTRKKFPSTHFTYTTDIEEIQNIISSDFYCWYGVFDFKKLQYKVDFPIDLSRFGSMPDGADMCEWCLLLTNVDNKWFKKVFKWESCACDGIYYAEQKELCKDYAKMFQSLFEDKDSQKKGTFAREIYKFRAELPFGQPIKALEYAAELGYDPNTNEFIEIEGKELSFKQKRYKLLNRGIPMYVSLWVAAYARLEFFTVWEGTHCDNYGDTDSVSFQGDEGIEFIKKHNKEIENEFNEICKKRKMSYNGKMGKWIDEGDVEIMKQIGIKWYMLVFKDGSIKVKASGADKDVINNYFQKESKNPLREFTIRMQIFGLMKTYERCQHNHSIKIHYCNKLEKEQRKEIRGRKTGLYYYNPWEEENNEI